jgi:hypothetical protein
MLRAIQTIPAVFRFKMEETVHFANIGLIDVIKFRFHPKL